MRRANASKLIIFVPGTCIWACHKQIRNACSADGFVGRKSGKITAARKALERWSETFDYDAAAGQASMFRCNPPLHPLSLRQQ